MTTRDWKQRLEKVENLTVRFERCPLQLPYRPRLSKPWQPSSLWRIFCRQNLAFNFARSSKQEVHVFAMETKAKEAGKRLYLVTSYAELWHYYKAHRESLMHCYEVIPEGSVCKLYFDLEFQKLANPACDGKLMVTKLIQYVCQKLEEFYKIRCTEKDVLILDSSTEEKFSQHLIFVTLDAVFKDNTHVGNFVRNILQPAIAEVCKRPSNLLAAGGYENMVLASPSRMWDPRVLTATNHGMHDEESEGPKPKKLKTAVLEFSKDLPNMDLSFLVVNTKDGFSQLFVDLGVYTKNRNFRLYKSSKVGKDAMFEVAEGSKFVPKPPKNTSVEEQFFLYSLVSNIRFSDSLKILTCDNSEEVRHKSCTSHETPCSSVSDAVLGDQKSPYPEIDQFVISVVNKDGIQGGIRCWTYFSVEELLVYEISKYRWCENIGRAHKSNHIMIVVNLKNLVWYQKCHDPVCRVQQFKSQSYPLPEEVCLDFFFTEEEESEVAMDEFPEGSIEEIQSWGYDTQENEEEKEAVVCNQDEDWDDGFDDDAYLEAAEKAECDATAGVSMPDWRCTENEVPDKLLLDAAAQLEASF
ncbi:DNA-directed primase/polymerase protein [Latimeria chalumnae]|uniref:DNA-directed primase/polymerase protein n=1 Tax=Latimeria chalumnae TaxID=7897 RepID=UPI0006D8E2A3|nr:PREDICTED: DNA-directed primase/polymerase protein [Latimeria chalumnae]XP_014351564.1 PREDICTED: DNA-directed primase/polymerase protein [Latimeria chalumnae]|eukprot:XP_014351563.1 PREDICTED: DNA-directed primase/polymerase protein [Latimeria chalumnae]